MTRDLAQIGEHLGLVSVVLDDRLDEECRLAQGVELGDHADALRIAVLEFPARLFEPRLRPLSRRRRARIQEHIQAAGRRRGEPAGDRSGTGDAKSFLHGRVQYVTVHWDADLLS